MIALYISSVDSALLQFHEWHSGDRVIMEAYRAAIHCEIKPGDVVIDIGAGTGILSFLACEAGAARVYAVECTDIADVIPLMTAANGIEARVVVCKRSSFRTEIPERADVVIASML